VVDHPIMLAGIIVAFVVFGLVVAYVDLTAGRRPDQHPAE
jgi:hypothetical protein